VELIKKILLVDDIKANIIATRRAIMKMPLEIFEAQCGNEALRLMLRQPIDLVLMDVRMPLMDGYETAQYLRDVDEYKTIPIVFVTGNDASQVTGPECFRHHRHIHKPFSPDEICEVISEILFDRHKEVNCA